MNIINFPAGGKKHDRYAQSKASVLCDVTGNASVYPEVFRLSVAWPGTPPKAGQFFMIKPERSSVFLGRPISVSLWEPMSRTVQFLIAVQGRGTMELSGVHVGERVLLIGPLGNAWTDFLPELLSGKQQNSKALALIGGGLGMAPLQALVAETLASSFDFYAGFATGFADDDERRDLMGAILDNGCNLIIATEDGSEGLRGRIADFLVPKEYAAVCACGPYPMLKAVAEKCKQDNVPCYVSMEQHMACGTGACLGCTIGTKNGNRRCCTDGPIFKAEEVF